MDKNYLLFRNHSLQGISLMHTEEKLNLCEVLMCLEVIY